MIADKRLNEVFRSAPAIDFDDSAKFIFFSDVHRGDNTAADDFAHNQMLYFHALKRYYDEGFTYIEIGDGDELWENAKFEDIRQAHSHIFWLMSQFYGQKRLYLIWGNHDRQRKNPKWVEQNLYHYFDERSGNREPLFPGIQIHEGLILRHVNSEKKIHLVHGHQGQLLNDSLWWIGRFFVRNLWRPFQLIGAKDPTSPAKNYRTRQKVERQLSDWAKRNGQLIIAGHTHRPVFPKAGEAPYFNDGSCVHPRCITGIELLGEEIALIKWLVNIKDDGTLFVDREVLEGPERWIEYCG